MSPQVRPYDPLNIPNPSDLRRPEVSPKGEGLRKVAEANRQVVDELHQGDQMRAYQLSRAYGAGMEGAAKLGGQVYQNYKQASVQLNAHLANANASKIVDDQQYNLQRYSDYVQSKHANDPVAALTEYIAGVQNGVTIPQGQGQDAIVIQNHDQLKQALGSFPQDPTPELTRATGLAQAQRVTSTSALNFHNWYSTAASNKVTSDADQSDANSLGMFEAGGSQ